VILGRDRMSDLVNFSRKFVFQYEKAESLLRNHKKLMILLGKEKHLCAQQEKSDKENKE
jgi:hypothetical protein